jgi:hypothetical protein
MFNEVEGMLKRVVTGEVDNQSVTQAAGASVASMEHKDLTQHVQTAANNAQQNGQPDLAQQLFSLLEESRSNPQALKSGVISLIENNPQILQQFAPEFAKSVLGRI